MSLSKFVSWQAQTKKRSDARPYRACMEANTVTIKSTMPQTAKEIFEQLLTKRGIDNIDNFANPDYTALADPFLMPDMDKAVERIVRAITDGEKIAIYGDYDIDGMTATTILTESLSRFGAEAVNFIPSRFIDGYGMGKRGVDELKSMDVRLIITVDTGSLSHEHIDYAKSLGIDVIVTDHHTVGETLPNAIAIINPKRPDTKYPCKDLAGVGVAFTLIRALQTRLDGLEQGQEKWLLDLVAMGTVCDSVPLTGENRILTYWGIRVAQQTRRAGLRALAELAAVDLGKVATDTFGFRFGPRLNASGRLDTARLSMNLLAASDMQTAREFAESLEEQNTERRRIQDIITKEAIEQASTMDDTVLVVSGEGWSHGVVGIVASRLVEEFLKPVFVLGIDEAGKATGSARSFGNYHLAKAIMGNRKLIEKGGGHAAAAGVTLPAENIDAFRAAVNAYFAEHDLEVERQHVVPKADLELADFGGLDHELISLLATMEPFGVDNACPLFAAPVVIERWQGVGQTKTHAKALLRDSTGVQRDSIGFGLAKKMPKQGSKAKALFHLETNEWNGRISLQHRLVDILPA